MFSALLLQQLWKRTWTEWRETPMTLSAPLTILCRAFLSDILPLEYHVEMYVRTLSTTPLQKVLRMLLGREACFSFLRKCSLCWDRLKIAEVFLFQHRSYKICTPRNLMFSTLSTVQLLMLRGACSGRDLKSMFIAFVLSTLSSRLFSLHQPSRCLTSSLYIDSLFPRMSPTTVVSSANSAKQLLLCWPKHTVW